MASADSPRVVAPVVLTGEQLARLESFALESAGAPTLADIIRLAELRAENQHNDATRAARRRVAGARALAQAEDPNVLETILDPLATTEPAMPPGELVRYKTLDGVTRSHRLVGKPAAEPPLPSQVGASTTLVAAYVISRRFMATTFRTFGMLLTVLAILSLLTSIFGLKVAEFVGYSLGVLAGWLF